ncbi:ATP-dependent RNA helicase DDX46/PRP5 [Monoraphidium neglectum]|uniref:ATP-dependent RNA helicase DDX46/PRP5 n=1 Tax=Monoraphidium neglectum TaxID=145388 RepID=A0A0D2LGP8_9CHLO|nr:ATP-dependent RNA helicase DDX46/PRP5 [Monoraphidium neglectum]KIY91234.1 ATP-dependent RNA helicase DDX46/PRP5 [Monoraphidium neglectum]|eukprot:XP_013890254.1 ATP-dependent RNA helicase DDX46/PRP5 [Monoraphidium neglectum]
MQYIDDSDSDAPADKDKDEDDAAWAKAVTAGKMSKGDKLAAVDHSAVEYPPFRRNFYIEVPEIAKMSDEDVAKLRKELDGIKVRGRAPPRPIRTWHQAGLYSRVLDAMLKSGFETPLPIQAQALPIIMSGRDCIGIAKTGSGKTLAFVLPLLRHVKDQPPLAQGDGPIGLIMAPTRELVAQIAKAACKLCHVLANGASRPRFASRT